MTPRRSRHRPADGQTLVLFAICLTALIGVSALVVDVGLKYSTERRYQAVADAASLAGAQELKPVTRSSAVSEEMRTSARARALQAVVDELAPGAPTSCVLVGSVETCSIDGGAWETRITTPSPVCVDCVPDRSVQVRVAQPQFSTMFGRLFGQTTWRLERVSVAGLSFGKAYTIVALRPPQPLGSSSGFDVRDIRLDGGTVVRVTTGDVGTNSNMEYGGIDSRLVLDPGYAMYYFDPYHDPEWAPPNPPDPAGRRIGTMIEDPGYVIPSATGGPAGAAEPDEAVGGPCESEAAYLLADPAYGPYVPSVPGVAPDPPTPDMSRIDCYRPGVYTTTLAVDNGDLAILLPGLYWLAEGLDSQGSVIGGYRPAPEPGVALVFRHDAGTRERFNTQTSGGGIAIRTAVALNAGSRFGGGGGSESAPALDFAGREITTNGTPPVKMTVMVTRDPACQVVDPYPAGCVETGSRNHVVNMTGSSDLFLAGVQFMPTDNATINSSGATGYVGQIWAWTIQYAGGTTLDQEGTVAEGPGRIRIDSACSPAAPCD